MSISSGKRLAKNTVFLYIRMIFMMLITLYSSRIVLKELGIIDFGLYNVIGGVVLLFSFLNGAMTAATQRFLSYELGKLIDSNVGAVFKACLHVHLVIALIVFVFGELIGLWMVNYLLKIPQGMFYAANIVFQFSLLTVVISVISIPYNALIIAFERMSVFSYISILDALLKLLAAFILIFLSVNKLVYYAVMLFIFSLMIRFVYALYCKFFIVEIRSSNQYSKEFVWELTRFASWNLVGNLAVVTYTQGINILLNVLFGSPVNAARALALQVQTAIIGFSSSFQMAINPQITKTYSSGKLDEMHSLIFISSKLSFLLIFLLSFPILIETKFVLVLWLGQLPDYATEFCRIALLISIVEATSNPLIISAQATGNIKKYQLTVGGVLLLIIPISYAVAQITSSPISVFYVQVIVTILAQIIRLLFVRNMVSISLRKYFIKIVGRAIIFSVVVSIVPYCMTKFIEDGWERFIYTSLAFYFISFFSIYYIYLDKDEKIIIFNIIKQKILAKK
ncbi:lipopolysaccharide biosynthesis protein [Klebsiella sp. RHBSTW-00215]|uniref:lipopolysaccharide biosynthesis protein n=1 Tax=Klebsiella sp. RHBSTW-00215 TaxID=2742640 RepID=UPI0015F717E2|nr:lipopolysaccharide biosynthesis protein [Klebsiella sp. RHBSTW-00215]MBA7934715.1 lipopolysaccharide biosynthesis protein [Klebsiella sp. RHBSTW-00215]